MTTMTSDPVEWLRDELRRSIHGGAWHGPSVLESLADVSPALAVARPIAGGHTIAELTHHVAGWMEEVNRRLDGTAPAMPARGDWPSTSPASEFEWAEWVTAIGTAADQLDRSLASFPPDQLSDMVGAGTHDPPLGSGVSYAAMLNGVIQHNVYHAGQILLLARAAR